MQVNVTSNAKTTNPPANSTGLVGEQVNVMETLEKTQSALLLRRARSIPNISPLDGTFTPDKDRQKEPSGYSSN